MKQLGLFGESAHDPEPALSVQRAKHYSRFEKVHGQFLTPPEVARFIVRFASIKTKKATGVDPACGDGVFLGALAEFGFEDVLGIDSDPGILSKMPAGVKPKRILADGLTANIKQTGIADVVVGNPPFSAKYGRIRDRGILSKFHLGRGRASQAIEVLFLERFLQIAAKEGAVGIILPQGIFSSLPMEYVRSYLLEYASIIGIVSLPRGIFTNGTTSKTCILFANPCRGEALTFMAMAEDISDLDAILRAFKEKRESEDPPAFWGQVKADILDPAFYWSIRRHQISFDPRLEVVPLHRLLKEMRSGAAEFGDKRVFAETGIRFISAKTITHLGIDFARRPWFVQTNGPMDKRRAYVSPGDVLFVRVGVGCSGRVAAIVDESETGVADDWMYILRTKGLSPYYLAMFLYAQPGKVQVDRLKRGVGAVNVPMQLLKQILVPIPPKSFQDQIEVSYRSMVALRRKGDIKGANRVFAEMQALIESRVGARPGQGQQDGW